MTTANVSDLKNRLSHFLRLVRKGEPILVYDRDPLVARLEPVRASGPAGSDEDWAARLESRGIARRPLATLPADLLERRPRLTTDAFIGAILDDREEGR